MAEIRPLMYPELDSDLRWEVFRALERAITEITTALCGIDAGSDPFDLPPAQQRDHYLARLAAMESLAEYLRQESRTQAYVAGGIDGAPATYAELGSAAGITRQAARERWPGAVPGAKAGRPRKQVTVTLSGGHPYWDGRELEYDRASVYDLDLGDVGALLMIEDGSCPDHLSIQEGVGWRAHYAPKDDDTRTTWVFQGWVPA